MFLEPFRRAKATYTGSKKITKNTHIEYNQTNQPAPEVAWKHTPNRH